ncbi:uncharacterized protein LOC133185792 [Saccostrea echinata]|uniref:uncharacterized protein LOC133185792 n=1 Tax=Saccostrea echinata TaxID=191078 RepID=UPI002A83A611|nr:uncharacterized protein LOC133185792 [Saccostrea echinata]
MIALTHIFPLESPCCHFSENRESTIKSVITANVDHCVLKSRNIETLQSLLFQCAVSYATKESNVTYICRQPLSTLPAGVHGMPKPEADVLKTVKFLYLKNVEEVVEFCATVHNRAVGPDLIILDDIDSFIEQLQGPCLEHKAAKLCALLCDAADFITSKNDGSSLLLLSCTDSTNRLASVFRNSGIHVHDIQEVRPNEFKLTTIAEDNHICVDFITQKGELYLQDVHITEK